MSLKLLMKGTMNTINYHPRYSGPCAKALVRATLVALDGKHYTSTNFTLTPQATCPRGDMPADVGYELCKTACSQPSHAEINVLYAAKGNTKGATMYIEYKRICDACRQACEDAGVANIVLGKPPNET